MPVGLDKMMGDGKLLEWMMGVMGDRMQFAFLKRYVDIQYCYCYTI